MIGGLHCEEANYNDNNKSFKDSHRILQPTSKTCSDFGPLSDLLKQYYCRLFPFIDYYHWLSYGNEDYFANREFSFTLRDDIYIRYQSFNNWKSLKESLKDICPNKIDVGAVYSARPNMHKSIKSSAFKPLEKELVFDLDMTDYDDVRICCQGADVCRLCWPFMTAAVEVLDSILREDFGFKQLLWVYSGRRGIHCWACDKRARALTSEQRNSVISYLSVVTGGEHAIQKVQLSNPAFPLIERSTAILLPYFEEIILKNQKLLQNDKFLEVFLSYINNKSLSMQLKEDWLRDEPDDSDCSVSLQRWKQLEFHLKKLKKWEVYRKEVVLHFTYPRLDVNVSKQLHHLLKSPFSVHPKSGKICVPIFASRIHDFDPFNVPTISDLCREADEVFECDARDSEDESI
ncbi:DNA primase small subunit-like isoform X2 [Zophobas morio]|uniref:DNA primase small subunit-like isoform X2 n=1 Tax=Zophobas morio TaxID=2755281 RepID=UPI0030839215